MKCRLLRNDYRHFLLFLILVYHYAVNWCDELRVLHLYLLFCGFSYSTRIVSKRGHTHTYIHDSFVVCNLHVQTFNFNYMGVITSYSANR